jgi:hypothetical protein
VAISAFYLCLEIRWCREKRGTNLRSNGFTYELIITGR